MTEPEATPGGGIPISDQPNAVAQEPAEVRPAQDAPAAGDDAQPEEDWSAKAADLEAQLAEVRAKAAGQDTVRLKVEEPHVAFGMGHINVESDWTEVPTHAVAAIMEGAANSGVTITQEEG